MYKKLQITYLFSFSCVHFYWSLLLYFFSLAVEISSSVVITLYYIFFFFFWPYLLAYGILVPWPGFELKALGSESVEF